jgi:hypothetical protein
MYGKVECWGDKMKFDEIWVMKDKPLFRSYSAEDFLSACDKVIEGVQEVLERYGGGKIIIQDFEMKMEKSSATVVAKSVKDSLKLLGEGYNKFQDAWLDFKSNGGIVEGYIAMGKYPRWGSIVVHIKSNSAHDLREYEDLREAVEGLKHFKRKKSFPSLMAASDVAIKKRPEADKDFPYIWVEIPDDKKDEKIPDVWESRMLG